MDNTFRFRGTYMHNLDDKGRLALPGSLREELRKSATPEEMIGFVDGGFIALYPQESWRALEDRLNAIEDPAVHEFMSLNVIGRAVTLNFDKAGSGRLTLSPYFRQRAGLDKEVAVVGTGNRIQIWDRVRLEEREGQDAAILKDQLRAHGIRL